MQHLLDPAVEAFDHLVGLRVLRRCEAVFDAKVCAELVELERLGGVSFAQTEQAVGEFLAIAVRMVRMHSWQALSRSCRKRRALAAVLKL